MNNGYLKLVMLSSLLGSCGASDGVKGFFSDANICRPIENETYDPTDIFTGHFAIPAITTGVTRNGQLTTAETTKKSVWGAEMYLSSGLDLVANMRLTPMVKRKNWLPTEVTTLGPDNELAANVSFDATRSMSATIVPSWVRTQFSGVVDLEAGDAMWLVTEPDYSGEQTVMWWYTGGDGTYVSAAGTPLYVNFPGIRTVHRLIYCK
jgi:hypothetical protein